MMMMLVFEFVLLIKKDKQVIEMSSGWCSIDLHLLKQSKTHLLQLNGGGPQRQTTIDKDDILARRKGWRKVVKSLSKPIESKLKIEVKTETKMTKDVKNHLEYMPAKIVVPKNYLHLYHAYRDYIGRIYIEAVDRNRSIDLE